jgi:sugar lactone lactonase YvrE
MKSSPSPCSFRSPQPSSHWVACALAIIGCLTPPPARAGFQVMQKADRILGNQILPERYVGGVSHIAFDEAHGKAYFISYAGDRVLRFSMDEALQPTGTAEAVFGQPNFETSEQQTPLSSSIYQAAGMCVDGAGRLWVADSLHHRVLRFDHAWDKPSFSSADGVLGQTSLSSDTSGISPSMMNHPMSVAVDRIGNLYVADNGNNRVLRFNNAANKANGAAADAVLGQASLMTKVAGTSATTMKSPVAVAVEAMASPGHWRLWVSDRGNHRLLRFDEAPTLATGAAASGVLGQPNFVTASSNTSSTKLDAPMDIALWQGNLWVSDFNNNRVLRWQTAWSQPNGAPANSVLGQPDFISKNEGEGAAGLNEPWGLGVENGRLWVGDTFNSRVVRWVDAAAKPNGEPANGVLGASELVSNPAKLVDPGSLAIDPVSGKLFVSDRHRNRVLRYANEQSLANDAAPEAVFGQSNFVDSASGVSGTAMDFPTKIWVDTGGRLWVSDTDNNRVLRFDNAATRPSGASADRVLGQPGLNSKAGATTPTGMKSPYGLCVDAAGHLWVVDTGNFRVLRFTNAVSKATGAAANGVLGQPNFTTGPQGNATASTFGTPVGIFPSLDGRLWVTDLLHNRVLRFDAAAAKPNGAAADGVIGQPDFTKSSSGRGPAQLTGPAAVALDSGGSLWVADQSNHRLVQFSASDSLTNGPAAISLLGQETWNVAVYSFSANRCSPSALAFSPNGGLWVATGGRVMHFTPEPIKITEIGRKPDGEFFLTFNSTEGVTYNVRASTDLQTWSPPSPIKANGSETTYIWPLMPTGDRFFLVEEP